MVTWAANSIVVSIRIDNGVLIVEGPSGHETANNLQHALARIRAALNGIFAGATGVTGWSLTLEFPGIRAPYGDALPNLEGGRGVLPKSVRAPTPSTIRSSRLTLRSPTRSRSSSTAGVSRKQWHSLRLVTQQPLIIDRATTAVPLSDEEVSGASAWITTDPL